MRVLVLADLCNPEMASTPYFAWKLCCAIAEHTDEVVVATHVRNRQAIEQHGIGRARPVFIDSEYVARPMSKIIRVLRGGTAVAWTLNAAMLLPSCLAFEWEVWKRFRSELRNGGFDVVHRVSPLTPTLPSPLAGWSPVPFVLGPVNGGLRWPSGFAGELAREREWMTYLRGFRRMQPFYRSTYSKSAAILAGFAHTIADIPRQARARAISFPDVGFDPEVFKPPAQRPAADRCTILFIGRLVPYKCPDVVVEAFVRSAVLRGHRLRIIGEGPERSRLERIIRDNHLESCVELLGWRSHEQIVAVMAESGIFAFPSIRELGAGVVLEAMGAGLACVVVDYGGPGHYINSARGVKLPLGTKDELIAGYVRELESLVQDPLRREQLGKAAHEYALENHSWDAKGRTVAQLYRRLTGCHDGGAANRDQNWRDIMTATSMPPQSSATA